MGKKAIIAIVVIIIIILAVAGVLIFAPMHKVDNTKTSKMDTMNMPPPNDTSSQPSNSNSVTIQDFAFSPSSITIKKGTTVTWTNKDSTTHTVTETDGQTGPDSGNLVTGKSYSFTYDTAGTFKYHCAIHPDMLGTVTVTE